MREKVKNLWKLCFNDSEEFVELYFRLRYNAEVNLAMQSGDDVIAAMQLLPYPMTCYGSVLSLAYVSGACTHPEYRGRGVMSELLSQAFGNLYRQKTELSALIPTEPRLFGYYERLGYAPVFHHTIHTFSPTTAEENLSGTKRRTLHTYTEFDEAVFHYLDRHMQARPCCIQHTESDFRVVLADLFLSDGRIFTLHERDRIVALALTSPGESPGSLTVNELLADDDEAKQTLLNAICHETETGRLTIIAPPAGNGESHPLGMIRIIQAKKILRLYAAAHPEVEMNIALTDKQLSANNGYYYLNNGRCMRSRKRLPGAHEELSIAQLAEKIFGSEQAYMSLMVN